MFTTSILSQQQRNKPTAWKPLGYVYDLSLILSSNEEKQLGNDLKYSRLHTVFRAILQSFVEAQQPHFLDNIPLKLGQVQQRVNLKIPCFFIIGDMQGGDKLCACAPVYSNQLKRLCRKCDVRGCDAGNPHVVCNKIIQSDIQNLVQTSNHEQLAQLNQYCVNNAWFDADFGGCKYGIFSAACPIEPLHAIENGLVPDCLKILFRENIKSASLLAELDCLARELTELPRQQFASSGSDKAMPRLLWKDGITSLTDLTASAKVGIMFTVVVIGLTRKGEDFFMRKVGNPKFFWDMMETFQMILCYWMWLKKDTYWTRNNQKAKQAAKNAIRTMLSRIIHLWPRYTGQQWELPKFHEQLHVPDDIYRNGSPKGSHSGPTEHNHIVHVKQPAQTTQKRHANLDKQISERVTESHVINLAMAKMENVPKPHVVTQRKHVNGIPRNATTWVYRVHREHDSVRIASTSQHKGNHTNLKVILKRLFTTEFLDYQTFNISVNSECYCNGHLLRAHPNYRGTGEWYDWAMVRWHRDTNDTINLKEKPHLWFGESHSNISSFQYSPTQILGFVVFPDNTLKAVVSTCEYGDRKGSVFSSVWRMAYLHERGNVIPYCMAIDIDTIISPSLVIPTSKSSADVNQIWPRELWADEFFKC